MSVKEPLLDQQEWEMQTVDPYEDNFAFARLHDLAMNRYRHLISRPQLFDLLQQAYENSLENISEAEQQETLRILREFDPIRWDLLVAYVDANLNYQMFLKRLIMTSTTKGVEISKDRQKIMSWYSFTGKVSPEYSQYQSFAEAHIPKEGRPCLILTFCVLSFFFWLAGLFIYLQNY
ncbi:hypothetical protein CANTEDRAFT_91949 [Yamadazyma tenuis ATCC 10573]|uniref:Uncharacterized protein n=1 Tax=Candida tenuis (strain ATCC 10573 / BCRC 21748 / CBS 615 / JCM 9827 / NBRC 10315 / NRRL Y-1498 / VKM Y-70) TaxID=590646 RepID=G3AZP6_CANTC|nr:uncharacterized protein CANTEDRAFT_91949 [Yamadazyma tenuis ATCC 10573]EGV65638.1 hypothetical protein CANTEDRAFT_91949 [Yamadazyma tenuis ATCC 10573]